MKTKKILQINVAVFSIVVLLHLYRSMMGLTLTIGKYSLPPWTSYLAALFAGGLAFLNYKYQE